MPNVDQPRRLVVTILVSLLVGCTPSENIRSAERMPETHEQVPSGLIAFILTAKVPMRYLSAHPDGSGIRRLTRELPAVSHPPGRRTGSGSRSMPDRPPPATST